LEIRPAAKLAGHNQIPQMVAQIASHFDGVEILVHPRLKDHYPLVGIQQFNGQELKLPLDTAVLSLVGEVG